MPIDITNKEEKQIALTGAEIEEALLQAHLSKDAIEKIAGLESSASEIDSTVDIFKQGIPLINFVSTNMYSKDSWILQSSTIRTDKSFSISRFGTSTTQSKIVVPFTSGTVVNQKYILLVNLENLNIINPSLTQFLFTNYTQIITKIDLADYIASDKKIIAIPFTATVAGTTLQLVAGPGVNISALPTGAPLVNFDMNFFGIIPWSQKDEDYWTMVSNTWVQTGFSNLKAATSIKSNIADYALNAKLPESSFKEIKNIADRAKDIYNANIVKWDSVVDVISSSVSTTNGKFNCSASVDLTAKPSARGWFGLDIQPANYATEDKSYVLIMVGTGVFQNVETMIHSQPTSSVVFVQDPTDGATVNIKEMIRLDYSAGLDNALRYTAIKINTRKTTSNPSIASYSLSLDIYALFEEVEGFSIDDYINAYNSEVIVPLYSKTGTATETYVNTNLSIAASSIALGLTSNSFSPKYDVEMLLSGGQSLNIGGGAAAIVNDFKNTIAFPGGSGLLERPFTTAGDKAAFFGTDFVSLGYSNEIYPPVTASLTSILRLLELENRTDINNFGSSFIPFAWGASGSSITKQYKGSTAYTNMIEVVTKANEFVTKKGKTFAVRAMNWYHGENDRTQTKEWYYNHLTQLFTDINTDIKAITGQIEDIEFFTYQTAGWSDRNMGVQEAQLQLAIDRADVHLAGAMYQFNYFDDFHPSDRAIVGLQTGVAIKRVIYDNLGWTDFKPISHIVISSNGKYYTHLKFGVPVKPMRFDISGDIWHNSRGKQPNFGFEVIGGGVEKQTAEPFVTRGDTVVLTTDENPVGMTIKYAVTGHDGGGNLCDSQNIIIRNKNLDYAIDNFAAAFSNYIID